MAEIANRSDATAEATAATAGPPSPLRRALASTACWIAVANVVLIVIFGATSPDHVFWSIDNYKNLAVDASQALLLTTGVALILGAGELDISLGANLILSSVVGGEVMLALADSGEPTAIALGIAACVATGATVGLVNGFVIARMEVNSLITTLAMMGIATGIAFLVTDGADIAGLPEWLQSGFGTAELFGLVPLPALVAMVFFGVAWLVLVLTRPGMRLLAMGSSREAAERSGLNVRMQVIVLFAVVGALAGVAGVIDLSRFGTTNVGGHQTDALAAIGAAVIGGTSLYGGYIGMGGALLGTLLAVILQNGLVIVGLSPFYQLIATGLVLIAAVYIDQQRKRRGNRAARSAPAPN
jgi:ribose transport system permease protein